MITIIQNRLLLLMLATSVCCGEVQRTPKHQQHLQTESPKHRESAEVAVVETPPFKPTTSASLTTCAECGDCLKVMSTLMIATTLPTWLPGEDQGLCDMDEEGLIAADEYTDTEHEIGKTSAGNFNLSYKGPTGSGRYWDVGVSFDDGGSPRGFCFLTSTVGWRHVGNNRELALMLSGAMWIHDVDGDGDDELVVPDSVQAGGHGSNGHDAILLTAYDRVNDDFVLDVESTLSLRVSIADAYHKAQSTDGISADDREHFQEAELELRKPFCTP